MGFEDDKLPKYTRVKRTLLASVKSGEYTIGEAIPSEAELMRRFSVSRFTIRQALAELVNEGMLRREQGRGTFITPVPDKKAHEQRMIALLSPTISTYIFPEVVRGIDEVAQEAGYQVVLANANHRSRQEGRLLQRLIDSGVAGVIVEPSMSALPNPNLELFRSLVTRRIPLVLLDSQLAGLDAPAIVLNDEDGGYRAVKYLVDLGHCRIAMVYKEVHQPAVNRFLGYKRALAEAGVTFDPALVRSFREPESMPVGYIHTKELISLKQRRPTAIFYYNDEVAVDGFRAIAEAGLSVPEDVSVVGFDDSTLAQLSPVRLTSMTHPKQESGRLAARLLLGQIDGSYSAERDRLIYLFQPELVIRDSCRSLAAVTTTA